MLQFLQPIWLWLSAGIIVPILIHLWHTKQDKTLKVGSLIFLQQSSKQQATSFKISEWLLLLLRCLLIILLVVLLAKPQWQLVLQPKDKKGWIVINKQDFKETYHHFKIKIDSLLLNNYELYYFEDGFKKLKIADSLQLQNDTLTTSISYWQLINQLNEKYASNNSIYLFTNNSLTNFIGNKAIINKPLKWFTYSTTDTTKIWLHKAYKTTGDSIKVIVGNSNNSASFYTSQNIAFKNGKQDNFTIDTKANNINLKNEKPILIDTSTLMVTIFTDKYFEDANYVKATMDAIKQFTKKQIVSTIFTDRAKLKNNANWLFWLSDLPLTNTLTNTKIVQYTQGRYFGSITLLRPENIGVSKSVYSSQAGYNIWLDGYGSSLLSIDSINPNIYNLFTHLNPSWNDLVWNEKFPSLLLSILTADENIANYDKRIVDEQQLLSNLSNTDIKKNTKFESNLIDILPIIWILAFSIFILERWLSQKQKSNN